MCETDSGYIDLYSRTIESIDSNDPADPFSDDMHRFIMGVEIISDDTIRFSISIDGSTLVSTVFTGYPFVLNQHSSYSRIACLNKAKFSSLAIFFRSPYPSQQWIDGSQETLVTAYRAANSHLATSLTSDPSISKQMGSVISFLDRVFFIGNQQEPVVSISRSGDPISLVITMPSPPVVNGSTITIRRESQECL